ncbi:MAG TPA: terminase family protein [Planctomycetota bacterium]|nr:terminase family protein [Planctomycetota bacterium]
MSNSQPSPPEAAEEMLRRRKARTEMAAFTEYTFPEYQTNWHHRTICNYLDKWVSGEITRLMVFAPPQHGKSELVSRRLPAYIMGRDPDASIIASTYSADLSRRMNRDTQRIIDEERYHRLFPNTRLFGHNVRHGTWVRNSDIFEVVDHQGVYRATGVGGGITGMGATHAIIDDPIKDDEQAYSPTIREKIYDWYRGTFYTRLRKDARVLLTMTRWHLEDLAGMLLAAAIEDDNADQWMVIDFEALRSDRDSPDDPRVPGEPLWPGFKTQTALHKIKATIGPTRFAAMYQQDPRHAGGTEWPADLFGPEIWFNDWPRSFRIKVAGLDPSKGIGTKWGDYSAFVWIVYGTDGLWYVDADMANDRPAGVIVDAAMDLQLRWKFAAFGVETNEYDGLLADNMLTKSRSIAVPFPVVRKQNTLRKDIRIRQLSPLLENRLIRFKGGSRGAQLLVKQLQNFPHDDHDDGPDALHIAVETLIGIWGMKADGLGGNLCEAMGGVR